MKMRRVKIIICGAMGRMGRNIVNIVGNDNEAEISGAVEIKGHKMMDKQITETVKLTDSLKEIINDGDVVIDFTDSQATMEHIMIAEKAGKPFVVGVTGFSDDEVSQINKISSNIPIAMAPNWGVGINLLFKLVGEVASVLKNYDVEIIETHHNRKKDAPSGTAYKLAESIEKASRAKNMVFGRKGKKAVRNAGEIGIHAVRGGNIIGDHTVIFAGDVERLEIVHRADTRECFGNGAVKAARWVISQPAGMYDMKNVLGLK